MKDGSEWKNGAGNHLLPLSGKRVLVTRAHGQAVGFMELLTELGAETIAFPMIEITEPFSWESVDGALKKLPSYDSIIFTSANGVKFFFKRFIELGYELMVLKDAQICAVGPGTAKEISRLGLKVAVIPDEFRAEGLLTALDEKWIRGRRFLLARAMVAREIITEVIASKGGYIDVAIAYRTLKFSSNASELKKLLYLEGVDVITFTSPSAVSSFVSALGVDEIPSLIERSKIACIGPVTAEMAQKHRIRVDIIPGEYSMSALATAIGDYFADKRFL